MHRFHRVVMAAAFLAGSACAQQAAPVASSDTGLVAPPPEWADYVSAVRKADLIKDPEQRCLAYPDLPGNEWLPGSAKARCQLNREPALSLGAMDAMLKTSSGAAELDRRFAALLDMHYNDGTQHEQIFVQFDLFAREASDLARQVADAWVKASPGSAYARTASGLQFTAAAVNARGSAFASQTSSEQFASMSELVSRAMSEFDKAMAANPKLSPACVGVIEAGRMESDYAEAANKALAHCLQVDPHSYNVVLAWEKFVAPQWGGSDEAEREASAYAAAHAKQNPMLGGLVASEQLMRARSLSCSSCSVQREDAIEAFNEAVRIAPSADALRGSGMAAYHAGDMWRAFAELSQSTRLSPRRDEVWQTRANLRIFFRDYAGAEGDATRAVALNPRNLYVLNAARSMKDPGARESALMSWCDALTVGDGADTPLARECAKELAYWREQKGAK